MLRPNFFSSFIFLPPKATGETRRHQKGFGVKIAAKLPAF
jgi:hypothetical protein